MEVNATWQVLGLPSATGIARSVSRSADSNDRNLLGEVVFRHDDLSGCRYMSCWAWVVGICQGCVQTDIEREVWKAEAKQPEAPRDNRTSWFGGSVVSDSYRQLTRTPMLRTISRFFTGLASPPLAPTPGGGQRSLAAIPRSV